ncbi:MAG: 50S ribosomal protein L25 [Clostridiales bacterium]|jgi:large subunit ribosomal protein L25|nr:50S ribosomal protein L25 [Eubacteriales bacterium]MDH7565722.1 50S ribosomal protein L25 [Clostridiales bacterium]
MSDSFIRAIERNEKPGQVRKNGFVPGVIYGKGMSSRSVKFDEKTLKRLLRGHTKNAKICVKMGEEVKQCLMKEIQKDPITAKILHIEMQAVHENDVVKLKVPILFNGREKLAERQHILQVFVSEVEIAGQAANMPEFVSVDVENKKLGDKITVEDIFVEPSVKIVDDPKEIYAVVTMAKEMNIAS